VPQEHVGALVPCFGDIQIGSAVGKCWPLSKTVCVNTLKVTKVTGTKKQFQKF
jgi:hypothetical protein